MLKIIFEFLTYILAAYGAYCLLIYLVNRSRGGARVSGKVKLALLVRDAEDSMEGVIRKIGLDSAVNGTVPCQGIAVVDMGSSDRTLEVLKRLKNEYAFLEVLEYGDRHKIFESFSEDKI